jgi:putative DNA primase/helicase
MFGYNVPQRFLILDGTANGGKGTLVRIIQDLVGLTNSYQLRTECLLERFETFRFRGKTLLIGPDVAGDFLMQRGASVLKSLVGGDPLSGEGKGLNGDFPMFGNFNVIMTCNSLLRVRLEGDTSAWRRRLLIVRYQNPPPQDRILDFHVPLLREEGSGILRWALAGFVKLQAEFAAAGDFVLTEKQRGRAGVALQDDWREPGGMAVTG